MSKASDRHTELLNLYQSMESPYYQWARTHIGDLRIVEWSYGRMSMTWDIGGPGDENMILHQGFMFGGHVASAADHIASLVTMSVLPTNDDRFRTSRLETKFFRPVKAPRMAVEARVLNVSRRLIHVEADLVNPEGKLAVRIEASQVRQTKET
ncbi:MAG: PaaI family thioesterase [Pseudomonadota bacterium]